MASMASTLSFINASPLVLKRAELGRPGIGIGPRAFGLTTSLAKPKNGPKRVSLVVKAQKFESDGLRDFKADLTSNGQLGEDLLDTSRFELTPWDYKEEANKIKMWFNMPGVASQDLRVYVKDNKLFVQGKHFPLPHNVVKENIKAKLGNGVLYVSIPKTKPDFESHSIPIQPVTCGESM